MLALDPGVPEEEVVCTPAIDPSKDLEISDTCIFWIFSPLTVEAAPVNDDFLVVP